VLEQLHVGLRGGSMITLVGMAGSGKTRLALCFGLRQIGAWLSGGGVWFTDLTTSRHDADLISEVAAVLGVPLKDVQDDLDTAAERIGWALAGRGKLLLILDNFEQLEVRCGELLDLWLDLAPELSILVTSRQPTRAAKEQVIEVAPLSVGDSIQLFMDRARVADPSFSLAASDQPVLRDLVEQLDRMPLAIELAAARVVVLTPRKILDRLGSRFKLLRGGRGGGTTLEAAIAWSWDLLEPWEQDILCQCTVFQGGFLLEAAEDVLSLDAHPEAPWVLDVLDALREKSLLKLERKQETSAEVRFGMFKSIEDFAKERAETTEPSWNALNIRHAEWYLRVGEDACRRFETGDMEGIGLLRAEHDNLRSVHRRNLDSNAEFSCRALVALAPFLEQSVPMQVLSRLLKETEQACQREHLSSAATAKLRRWLGGWNPADSSVDDSLGYFDQALADADQCADLRLTGRILADRVLFFIRYDRTAEAWEDLEAVDELARGLKDVTLGARVRRYRGHLSEDPQAAMDAHRAAADLWASVGNRKEVCLELNYLGILYGLDGAPVEAERCFRRGANELASLGLHGAAILLATNLGELQAGVGDFEASRATLKEVTESCRELGRPAVGAHAQISLLCLALCEADMDEVERLSDTLFSSRLLQELRGIPQRPRVVLQLIYSVVLRSQSQAADAVDYSMTLQEELPSDADEDVVLMCQFELGTALAQGGRLDEAKELQRSSKELSVPPIYVEEISLLRSLFDLSVRVHEVEYRAGPVPENERTAIRQELSRFGERVKTGGLLGVLCRFAVLQRGAARVLDSEA
jgi:predicted ATPase/tetratricopeptide (TPR) repeat protein